jgi:hypothetical protein
MRASQIVHSQVLYHIEQLASILKGKKQDTLTDPELRAFHLCRVLGLLQMNFGPEGINEGVIQEVRN